MKLRNSLTQKKEDFHSMQTGLVTMYSCGPTAYGPQHLGNLRSAVLWDFLRRTLEAHHYTVRHVINVTDFGHLTSDADEGEDKMLKGLKREGLPISMTAMKQLAKKYTHQYLHDRKLLNTLRPYRLPFASDHIQEQIELIQQLEEKGFVYTISDGVYFDTTKDEHYGRLNHNLCTHTDDTQSRTGVHPEKKHPADFAVWKFNDTMGWESPWGKGFPGWHIECSAMSMKYLGETFDIHTGGIEHIPIHHENELAQSYNATEKLLAYVWLHNDHLLMNNTKIAKSDGNTVYMQDVLDRNIDPLAVRYFFLQAHYRSSQNFTWDALEASQTAYMRLKRAMHTFKKEMRWWEHVLGSDHKPSVRAFHEYLADDLNTPKALAHIWNIVKDESLTSAQKYKTLLMCDRVLGLNLHKPEKHTQENQLDDDIQSLLDARKVARQEKNWQESDRLRDVLEQEHNIIVRDTTSGQEISNE